MIPVLGVPTLSRHDLCDRMLKSIDYEVQDLIVVDNQPNEWQPFDSSFVQRTHHIKLPQNLGVAGSWNLIIKVSPFASNWVIVNDDIVFEPGSLQMMAQALQPNLLQFFQVSPRWAGFAIGEEIVMQVGLFSELFHPAYFEDDDMERRILERGFEMELIPAKLRHDNSSTLKSGFDLLNHRTFKFNHQTHETRSVLGVMSGGEWELSLRRELSWD